MPTFHKYIFEYGETRQSNGQFVKNSLSTEFSLNDDETLGEVLKEVRAETVAFVRKTGNRAIELYEEEKMAYRKAANERAMED